MIHPALSIVICTYNGRERLTKTLDSVCGQQTNYLWELIIIDNASTDGSGDFCIDYLTETLADRDWKIYTEEQQGLVYARKAGLKQASFDWVLFCDDDNHLFPDYVEKAMGFIRNTPDIGVLGGEGIPVFEGDKPDWFDQYQSSFAVGPQLKGTSIPDSKLNYVYGAGSIFRKKPLLDLFDSGFQPALSGRSGKMLVSGDDVEWCWLMQMLGYKIGFQSDLKFYHLLPQSRLTWEYYLRLKEGISNGAGLLYSYRYFFQYPDHSLWQFQISYLIQLVKARLLFFKNSVKWESKPQLPSQKLALLILKSQMNSYSVNRQDSYNHFLQLKKYFGS